VSLLATASNILQHIEGNYGTPWTAGFPWFNNINVFGERASQPGFDLQRVGGILTVGKNFSSISKFQVSYQHTNAYLAHVNIVPKPDTTEDFIRSVKLTLILDHRDSFVDTKEGYYLSWSAEMSGAFFHGTNTFLRTIHQVKVFHKITSSTVFASAAQIGWVGNYRSADPLALSELFYAGGPEALRGFAYQCAGPLDALGTPLGGQFELVLNAVEIRQHLWKFLGVVGFWDVGNVFTNIDRFSFHGLRTTGGWGLRLSTPLGILRADQGFIVNPRPGERRERISISVGQAF
jgi:outer membrane protein insertion porin family